MAAVLEGGGGGRDMDSMGLRCVQAAKLRGIRGLAIFKYRRRLR